MTKMRVVQTQTQIRDVAFLPVSTNPEVHRTKTQERGLTASPLLSCNDQPTSSQSPLIYPKPASIAPTNISVLLLYLTYRQKSIGTLEKKPETEKESGSRVNKKNNK